MTVLEAQEERQGTKVGRFKGRAHPNKSCPHGGGMGKLASSGMAGKEELIEANGGGGRKIKMVEC